MATADNHSSDLQTYKVVLSEYFRAVELLPLIVSANQQVGDVYDVANKWAFLSSGSDCFPDLGKITEVPSSLPDVVELKQSQLGSAFGLSKILSLAGSASRSASVKLKFTDVRVRRASQMAFRRGLCPACEHLRPIVYGEIAPYADGQPLPIVVGTVLTAKREIFVGEIEGARAELTANAALLAGALPLEVINLNPTMSAALGYGKTSGCLLRSDTRLPIAIGPAFFPRLVFDRVQGGALSIDEIVAVEWRAAEKGTFTNWLSRAAESLPLPALT